MKSKLLLIILLCLVSSLQAGYMDTDQYWVLEDQEIAAWNGAVASAVTMNVVLNSITIQPMATCSGTWWIQMNPTNDPLLPNLIQGPGIKGWKLTLTNTGSNGFDIQLGVGNPTGWWQLGARATFGAGLTNTAYININDTASPPDQKDCTNMFMIFMTGSRTDIKCTSQSAHNYAYSPSPFQNTEVDPTTLTQLSWKNIDGATANDVYFGTSEPNLADPNHDNWREVLTKVKTILNPLATQTLSVSDLPPLQDSTVYYWLVDTYKGITPPAEPNFPGQVWRFTSYINQAPVVSLGVDKYAWLGQGGTPGLVNVTLTPVVTDDGRPVSLANLAYSWSKVGNSPRIGNLVFPLANKPSLTLPFDLPGVYDIQLDVSDTKLTGTDTVRITVGASACDAYRQTPGAAWFDGGDINQDCKVNIADLQILVANWLDCADFINNCQ
jgi:hypothetical protein